MVNINCSSAAIRAICSSVSVSVVVSSSSDASSSTPVAARRNARDCLIYAARTVASDSPCVNIAIPMILSSAPRFIPRTPVELRPAKTRISLTGKRIQRPRYVAKNTSWSSLHGRTEIKLSPSSNFIAILPFARIESKSDIRLRRTVPDAVANIRKCSWPDARTRATSSSGTGNIAVIVSPFSNGNRLTNGRPLAAAAASGNL